MVDAVHGTPIFVHSQVPGEAGFGAGIRTLPFLICQVMHWRRSELETAGKPIGGNDLLIAAPRPCDQRSDIRYLQAYVRDMCHSAPDHKRPFGRISSPEGENRVRGDTSFKARSVRASGRALAIAFDDGGRTSSSKPRPAR